MHIHAIMLGTVVILIVVVVHGALDQDHRALAEMFVNEQRGLSPCGAAEEIRLVPAVLCRLIDRNREPQILIAAARLLHGEVGSDSAHENDSVQHCGSSFFQKLCRRRIGFMNQNQLNIAIRLRQQGIKKPGFSWVKDRANKCLFGFKKAINYLFGAI